MVNSLVQKFCIFFHRVYLNKNEINIELSDAGVMKGSIMEGKHFESEGINMVISLDLDILAKFICGAPWKDLFSGKGSQKASPIQLNLNYKANKWAKASMQFGRNNLC